MSEQPAAASRPHHPAYSHREAQVYILVTTGAIALNLYLAIYLTFVDAPATARTSEEVVALRQELRDARALQKELADDMTDSRRATKRFNVAIDKVEAWERALKAAAKKKGK